MRSLSWRDGASGIHGHRGHGRPRWLHLFDSFQGMPETTEGLDQFTCGDFKQTSANAVAALLADYHFVTMHVGFIPDTFAGVNVHMIAWAHIDLDIYQSIMTPLNGFIPGLSPAGS